MVSRGQGQLEPGLGTEKLRILRNGGILLICKPLTYSSSHFQVFGLFNTLAYAAGAYFLYVEWKGTRANN
jgi:hypothetical protein